MNGYVKAGLCLALAAALVFGGYTVEGWRAERDQAEREREIDKAVARGAESNLHKVVAAQAHADWLQAKLAAAEGERDQLILEKNNAIRRLTTGRRCLDSAAVRVLNQPLRAGLNAGAVPEAASQPVPADAAFATDTDVGIWANEARRAYDTCRGRLQAIADFYGENE